MNGPHLTLFSADLLSKWGFNDGSDPDVWLDYCEANHVDYNEVDFPLTTLVRQHLIPALNQAVTVCDIETSHNPIRVDSIDGRDVTYLWHDSHSADVDALLTPEHVDVPLANVLRLVLAEAGLTEAPRYTGPLGTA
ncbi:hypothetical protein [Streptomyces sp. STR69]|uniref:hypothetical protein n=1 Tax=Streptomyces sp. STR69 TaxID=1796942 RepID=UPI0021C9054B|nr:hypothetical protein [Streptomyces sp. STR69]